MKCQKVKFTKEEAQKELERLKELKKYFPELNHKHYYFCIHCRSWHLTSQESKKDIRLRGRG